MLKTGIYVDAENIRLSGGYGMLTTTIVLRRQTSSWLMIRSGSVEDTQ